MGSSSRANSLGYGNEEIARAMYEQAKTLHYIGSGRNVTEPMVKLATRIAELAPGRLSKVRAVRQRRLGSRRDRLQDRRATHQASGKKPSAYKIISRWRCLHGGDGVLRPDWLPVRETIDPRVPGYSFVGNPLSYRNPLGMEVDEYEEFCVNHLERQIQLENPALVAAFIGEPIMQANGAQVPSKTYWRRVREICTKYRRAHDRRRGHHRLRSCGPLVCQRAFRHRAGHHDQREGADCRLYAYGRGHHARRDRGRHADLQACAHLQRPCGRRRGRQRRHRHQDARS